MYWMFGDGCHRITPVSAADAVPVGELAKFRRGRQTAPGGCNGEIGEYTNEKETFSGACYRAAPAGDCERRVLYRAFQRSVPVAGRYDCVPGGLGRRRGLYTDLSTVGEPPRTHQGLCAATASAIGWVKYKTTAATWRAPQPCSWN